MGRIRRDALDLNFLPLTSAVRFIGPKRIGCFSTYYDNENQLAYRPDNSSQKYLVSTELNEPIHCLEGFNPDTDKCLLPDTWPDFFRWIRSNEEIMSCLTSDNSRSSIDFICSNSVLKHIMLSPLTEVDWIINAIKIRETIFMFVSDEDPSRKRKQQSDNDNYQNKRAYSKFKVIRKITKQVAGRGSDSNTEWDVLSTVSISEIGQHHVLHLGNSEFVLSKDDVEKPIDCQQVAERESESNAELDVLSTVSISEIGQHRIMHLGNSEFVTSKDELEKPIDQASFAALKLKKNLSKGRNGVFFRNMYWWASALICGTETLICGDFDKDYTLRELDVLPASRLNKDTLASQKKCFITLDKILDFIKSKVNESNKFYDVHFNAKKSSREVTATLSVGLLEDSVSPQLFS